MLKINPMAAKGMVIQFSHPKKGTSAMTIQKKAMIPQIIPIILKRFLPSNLKLT